MKTRSANLDISILFACMKKNTRRLSQQTLVELSRRIQFNPNDVEAVNTIVYGFLPLVISIARHYIGFGLHYGDLIQEGNVGLIKAARLYDSNLGCKFTTYAHRIIRFSIMRAIDNQALMIRVPTSAHSEYRKSCMSKCKMSKRLSFLEQVRKETKLFTELQKDGDDQSYEEVLGEVSGMQNSFEMDPTLPALAKETLLNLKCKLAKLVINLRECGTVLSQLNDFTSHYGLNKTGQRFSQEQIALSRRVTRGAVNLSIANVWRIIHEQNLSWTKNELIDTVERVAYLQDFLKGHSIEANEIN